MTRFSRKLTPYITVNHGEDHAIGKFYNLTDRRYVGSPEDEQGEGYIFKYSDKFGISTNLANLTLDEALICNIETRRKIRDFLDTLESRKHGK